MRVIAGTAKGTRLAPVPRGVRPVSDMAREGLFSSLAAHVPGAEVLDLFAGSGALGIEALSRGAAHAVFVERSRAGARVIERNLSLTHLAERAEVVCSTVERFLMNDDKNGAGFDLCLVDPPYDAPRSEIDDALAALAGRWLNVDWIVALTRGNRSSMPVIPVDWRVARRLEYGDSLILVYRQR